MDAPISKSISRETSVAPDVLKEQRWAEAGENLAVLNYSEKIIEEKEKHLRECIANNYTRIKDVERELSGLQMQLKLSTGPKRSMLMMLRKKIELQNERVLSARDRQRAAKKVFEATDEALQVEEHAKERLCEELNMLVQQSAGAQLEKLEQLTERLERMNRHVGLRAEDVERADADAAAVMAALRATQPTPVPQPQPPPPPQEQSQPQPQGAAAPAGDSAPAAEQRPSVNPFEAPGQAAAAAPASSPFQQADAQQQQQTTSRGQADTQAQMQQPQQQQPQQIAPRKPIVAGQSGASPAGSGEGRSRSAGAAAATAARGRHVSLAAPRASAPAAPAAPAARAGPFQGFDA